MRQGSSGHSRVAVIGAGAIGGFFAAKLQEVGHEVTLCVRTPIESLILEQAGAPRKAPVRIVTHPADQSSAGVDSTIRGHTQHSHARITPQGRAILPSTAGPC